MLSLSLLDSNLPIMAEVSLPSANSNDENQPISDSISVDTSSVTQLILHNAVSKSSYGNSTPEFVPLKDILWMLSSQNACGFHNFQTPLNPPIRENGELHHYIRQNIVNTVMQLNYPEDCSTKLYQQHMSHSKEDILQWSQRQDSASKNVPIIFQTYLNVCKSRILSTVHSLSTGS